MPGPPGLTAGSVAPALPLVLTDQDHLAGSASVQNHSGAIKSELFFSDAFGVDRDRLVRYGAFDLCLVNDLPLFIDPFLLFHSEKPEYLALHDQMIGYLRFLKDLADEREPSDAELRLWYCFPEVKQNWLGYSVVGNAGSGLGIGFARQFHRIEAHPDRQQLSDDHGGQSR